jgi:F-type H+-transporting ATPase subunit b
MKALRDREDSIQNALDEAATARKEVEELKKSQANMEEAARIEKDRILKEAKQIADKNLEEATAKAAKIVGEAEEAAKQAIDKERQAAIADIKSQISTLSVQVAETLLKRELSDSNKQENLMQELINDLKVN